MAKASLAEIQSPGLATSGMEPVMVCPTCFADHEREGDCPGVNWADVIADLRARIARLEAALRELADHVHYDYDANCVVADRALAVLKEV